MKYVVCVFDGEKYTPVEFVDDFHAAIVYVKSKSNLMYNSIYYLFECPYAPISCRFQDGALICQ